LAAEGSGTQDMVFAFSAALLPSSPVLPGFEHKPTGFLKRNSLGCLFEPRDEGAFEFFRCPNPDVVIK